MFGTNGVPTIRTGFKSAAATVWFAADPDLIKRGTGFGKLAAPTAAKPIVKPTVMTIRRVWFMRGQRQPVIFVPVVTATGQVHGRQVFALSKTKAVPAEGPTGTVGKVVLCAFGQFIKDTSEKCR
jgi:hypothetical protein